MKLDSISEALPRANLVELVMVRVRAWIANGDLKHGDKLPSEKEMQEHFRVSRSVIREAISQLNALHLVDTFHGKGSYVTEQPSSAFAVINEQPTDDTFSEQLWEFRSILEPAVAKLAAQRRTDEDLEKLTATLQDMQSALERGEPGIREDDHFHHLLAQAIHNSLIERIATNIAGMAAPYKRLSLNQPFRPAATKKELDAVHAAVEKMDSQSAYEAMAHHISMSMRSVGESSNSS